MRFPWPSVVVAVLAALVVLCSTPVPATVASGTPTPSPTLTPTPSPTPTQTPYPPHSSTITIQFVQGGEPTIAKLWTPIGRIWADDVGCQFPYPPVVVFVSEFVQDWPFSSADNPPQPPECTKGPPTRIRFEWKGDFGVISTEVLWTGTDIVTQLEVPVVSTTASASPSPGPTASPAPTPTPATLPEAGGAPGPQRAPTPLLNYALVVLTLGAVGAWKVARNRR